jgi:hypothetical protein
MCWRRIGADYFQSIPATCPEANEATYGVAAEPTLSVKA